MVFQSVSVRIALLTLVLGSFVPVLVQAQTPAKGKTPPRVAKIRFPQLVIEVGNIKEDSVLVVSFPFENVGKAPLKILSVRGSCNCVVPEMPLMSIGVGEKSAITVRYTARNKVGPQRPVVTVVTNGVPQEVKLQLSLWVDQIPQGQ